jgi:hypothetical protein
VSDVNEVVSDVIVTAIETAGDAATVLVESARRRPRIFVGVAAAAVLLMLVALVVRSRRHATAPEATGSDHKKSRDAA